MTVKVTHNVNGRKVVQIMRDETAAWLTDIAEAFAGAEAGGRVRGVVRVLSMAGKSPPPSTPGNPPNWRTGSLARSWRTRAARTGDQRMVAIAGTDTKYASWLEYGTRRGLKPRPFMAKAVRTVLPYARDRKAEIERNVRQRLRGGGA